MVELNHVFASHALYQQNASLTLRGRATGKTVTASIERNGEVFCKNEAKTEKGCRFSILLSTPAASVEPWQIRISDGDEQILEDILFGELWLASGQSNMEVTMGSMPGHAAFYERMKGLPIRGYNQVSVGEVDFEKGPYPFEPTEDLPGEWYTAEEPALWEKMTALGTGVITELAETVLAGIPVGVVNSCVGGTPIEAWLPEEALCATEESRVFLTEERRLPTPENHNKADKWGCTLFQQSTVLYNLKIMPLRGITTRGLLWYQGECNIRTLGGRKAAKHYKEMLMRLQEYYAALFQPEGIKVYPVISSELYPFYYGPDRIEREEGLSYINDVFTAIAEEEPERFVSVPIYDLPPRWNEGNSNIHPMNKFELAARMARMLAAHTYGGQGMTAPGVYSAFERKGDSILVTVNPKGQKLWSKGEPKGFWISDWNGYYKEAQAEIVSENIIRVWREDIKSPAHAAYQYQTIQIDGNVYCGELPLASFATDPEGAIRLWPQPWLNTAENRVWAHKGDLRAYYTPVWLGEGDTETVVDPLFTLGKGSLRIFGETKELCAYSDHRRGEMMELWNYSALEMHLYNLQKGAASFEITQKCENGVRITSLKPQITPEEDNWNLLTFDLSGLSRDMVERIALRVRTETADAGVWMDGLRLK